MDNDSTVNVRERKTLYGLPCAECKTYYSTNLKACPICNCRERVPSRLAGPLKLEQPRSPEPD
jgi:hypothetical protein